MNSTERKRRAHDLFLSLPPQLQNYLAVQKKHTAENNRGFGGERYHFTRWYK